MTTRTTTHETPEQLRAITTLDRSLSVVAGPGSGKTFVLVGRYLEILESTPARIENIVAITFTKKAANQMRERLRREIEGRIESTRGTIAEAVWRERKRRLESAVISTFHGFCSRLLREHPIEAGIDPQFSTLDDYSAAVMIDSAAQAAVSQIIDDDDEHGAHLVAAYGRSRLVDHLVRTYNDLRSLGVHLGDAEELTLAGLSSPEHHRLVLSEIDGLVVSAFETLGSAPRRQSKVNAFKKITEFSEAWQQLRPLLTSEPRLESTPQFYAALQRLKEVVPPKTILAELRPWVDELRACLGSNTGSASTGQLEDIYNDVRAHAFVDTFFRALTTLHAIYSQEKAATGALDYEDLQLRARHLLSSNVDALRRVRSRFSYYLVDEFQDTNNLQREILELLTGGEARSNLFIVGDQKQSIYGFRGAEVEVFARMTESLQQRGGEAIRLSTNFRSDPRLVRFFNNLFGRLMRLGGDDEPSSLERVGFVAYEDGSAHRPALAESPAVELVTRLLVPEPRITDSDLHADDEHVRDREARRLAHRIRELVNAQECMVRGRDGEPRPPRYGDVAMLFRAMSDVKTYERELRRAGIPFYVVAGKGFYDRPEVADILSVLAFLENRTDELALASAMRSPLFAISDESLLALRSGSSLEGSEGDVTAASRSRPTLWEALNSLDSNPLVSSSQRRLLVESANVLERLSRLRNRLSLSELIEEILSATDFRVVMAGAPDGDQRLSNIEKLLGLARQFEGIGFRMLRDFNEFVRDFQRIDAREAEAQLRFLENSVALLTIHKAKGLEFPIVVVPDLGRRITVRSSEVLFDRYSGLAFKIPDGRGGLVPTRLFRQISHDQERRSRFESLRLFYVAATRAQDHLILSGAREKPLNVDPDSPLERDSWLEWLVAAVDQESLADDGQNVAFVGASPIRLVDVDAELPRVEPEVLRAVDPHAGETDSATDGFQAVERIQHLIGPVTPAQRTSLLRLPATALQSFANCPRQFYYARLLRIPGSDLLVSRDLGEKHGDEDVLPASLRGLVIHRFCEAFLPGDDVAQRLSESLRDILSRRGDAFRDILQKVDLDLAIEELTPMALNYLKSRMKARVDERLAAGERLPDGQFEFVRSEMGFTLRVPEGFVFGTIDKLLLTPLASGRFRAQLVDFKTNRIRSRESGPSGLVARIAREYEVQMQVYTHAVRTLLPSVSNVEATLHFLDPTPSVEVPVSAEAISPPRAEETVLRITSEIARGGFDPERFEARTGFRCAYCNFCEICPEGRASAETGLENNQSSQ